MHRITVTCLFGAIIACSWMASRLPAIDEFEDLVTISRLPVSQREIETAFRLSRGNGCEILPPGEPLEIRTFTSTLTARDRREAKRRVPIPASRANLFSVGLEFESRDQADLPALSRGKIVSYLQDNYVLIQGRIRRDLLDRKLYYHHRPLALTARYRGSRLTQAFEPIVSNTIREFHGLGLFVPEGPGRDKPEKFRTLVLLFRSEMMSSLGSSSRETHEFVFVRGRERAAGSLDSHLFVTTENRTQLHYLRSAARPTSPRGTQILGRIAVTRFDASGLYPKSSATRSYRLDTRRQLSVDALDTYCAEQGLPGGFARHATVVLDAFIDGKITAAPE